MEKQFFRSGHQKFLQLTLFVFGFFLISSISEIIYVYNNKPALFSGAYIYLSRYYASKGNFDKSFRFLETASNYEVHYQTNKYPNLIPRNFILKPEIPDKNTEFAKDYLEYAKKINIRDYLEQEEIDLGRIVYNTSLIAHKDGEERLTSVFLQTAVYIKPNLVHYHLELANYFLLVGDKNKAEGAINFCYNFDFPKSFCEKYFQEYTSKSVTNSVGFLNDALKSDYKKYNY